MKLIITRPTIAKKRPLQSVDLRKDERLPFVIGTELKLSSCESARNHWQVKFADVLKPGLWYIYKDHCKISRTAVDNVDNREVPPATKLLVPYKSQLDNEENPRGSCNVTSIAMCLEFLGIQGGDGQLEDELYRYAERKGYSRHDPRDLARIVRDYGRKDNFTEWATIDKCKAHLASGNPAVIHGYFTSFGHIIVLVGYDNEGFLVHDPYGEWFRGGYRTDFSGKFLHYSYNLIERVCIPDGQFWVHFISK
jgi:uncharacterized protein YvpB